MLWALTLLSKLLTAILISISKVRLTDIKTRIPNVHWLNISLLLFIYKYWVGKQVGWDHNCLEINQELILMEPLTFSTCFFQGHLGTALLVVILKVYGGGMGEDLSS